MSDSIITKFLERINPLIRTDIMTRDDLDFSMSMCSRFGRVKHFHVWHDNAPSHSIEFDYDKFHDVATAKSWLEVMEILQ